MQTCKNMFLHSLTLQPTFELGILLKTLLGGGKLTFQLVCWIFAKMSIICKHNIFTQISHLHALIIQFSTFSCSCHSWNIVSCCNIWGFHSGDYEEWCLLGCYSTTSQKTPFFIVSCLSHQNSNSSLNFIIMIHSFSNSVSIKKSIKLP
jgi:hypothetical protein